MAVETIGEWHGHLDAHFTALRSRRDSRHPGSPVFALEHGLDLSEELPALGDAVRAAVTGSRLPSQVGLPLVVYAAEIGYRYQGDEYWPVFEEETPGWQRRGVAGRKYIRTKYEMFAATFGGARPSGAWARWFKNIAWPITHAVLPADLQRHLARLLSDYRHEFTVELLENHDALGERLAAYSGGTSSRFQKFAENTSLLGLVAGSLLLGDEEETPLLSADVLRRIVADLSHERQAGAQLRNAKRTAVQVRRKGLLGRSIEARPESTEPDRRRVRLELTLSLRQSRDGWTVYVAVPSFEPLARQFPPIRNELERLRCSVEGVPGFRARGSLMYQQGPLAFDTMPRPILSPVAVEGASSLLSELLVDHCRISAEPWLFQIREAGLATQVRTNCVRPGQDYILLQQEAEEVGGFADAAAIDLTTQGVRGLRFSVPDGVDDAFLDTMRQIGLGLVSQVAVWPAGLTPSSWDGEGHAAWPAGDSPILGIRSQRQVAKCVVSTSEDVIQFPWPDAENRAFVQLSDLEIGTHQVEVVLLDGNEPPREVAQGRIMVRILEPVDSTTAASTRQGIQTWVHPARPTLDELWGGAADVVVTGPLGAKAHFEMCLMTRGGRKTLARRPFSSAMPVSEDRWHELLRAVQGDSQFASAVGRAEEILVVVSNPVLGRAEIRAERPFEPLRWSTGYDRDGPYARLIDHMGSEDLEIRYSDVTTPTESVQVRDSYDGKIRAERGALIIACADEIETAVVLPPHISGGLDSLGKLSVRPSLQTGNRSAGSVRRMIELARLWTRRAVPADQYAARLQAQVNDAIVARTSGMIAGGRWWEVELEVLNGRSMSRERLLKALGRSPGEREAATALIDTALHVGASPDERSVEFAQSLNAHGWRDVTEFADPILRLGTAPGSIDLADTLSAPAIDAVLEQPALVRLARCFALAIYGTDQDPDASLLAEWPWE